MDEDQCNMEEIEALLEDSDDHFDESYVTSEIPQDLQDPQISVSHTSNRESINDDMESSDDDIDDDELERLAALVTADEFEEQQQQQQQQQPATQSSQHFLSTEASRKEPKLPRKEKFIKTEETGHENQRKLEPEVSRLTVKKEPDSPQLSATANPRLKAKELETPSCTQPEATVLLKLSELSAMEEQIKMMKAQLLEQAKQISPELTQTMSSSAVDKSQITTSQSEAAASYNVMNPAPKMRLLEEDIFGTIETSPEAKQVKKECSRRQHTNGASSVKMKSPRVKLNPEESAVLRAFQPEDSDSDWEGLDGEKPANLSVEGKDIKKIINQGPRQRLAHIPNTEPSEYESKKKPYNSTWRNRPEGTSPSTSALCKPSTSQATKSGAASSDADMLNEIYSGIRIIKPLVSSGSMKSLMTARKMIRLSHLHSKVKTPELDSDWVTVAVMVSKSEPRKSAKGNQYSIWRLSDLADCDKIVSFFLFKQVFQELWKTSTGTVVGILNATVMDNTEKSKSQEVSIMIDNPKKLLVMGSSKDLGRCKSKTKAGNDCINFVNLQKGEYCTYHVQAAYKRSCSKRSELQAGFSGASPRSFEKKLFNKGGSVMYAGQTFTTASFGNAGIKSRKKTVSITSLQHHHAKKEEHERSKVSTLALHDLLPEDKVILNNVQKAKNDKNEKFHEALCVPTAGSLNLVKHMMYAEKIKEKEKTKNQVTLSVSAKDLLKSHQRELQLKCDTHQKCAASKPPSLSAVKNFVPTLGKGLSPETEVLFDFDEGPLMPKLKADAAKRKAIAKIQDKGGLLQENPNAIKKQKSPSQQERVKKRLNESTQENNSDEQEAPPPRKRSKILGNVNLESAEIQNLLKAKSKHDSMLTEKEQEKQEQYFEVLEKKEQMEQKMSSITEVKCKAFVCKQCKYRAMSMAQRCKDEKHQIIVSDAIKKFFECKECKHRTVTIERYPQHPCKKCDANSFIRCSMLKEKKGPKLASEELCLRGEEIKYLNSLK